MPFIIGGLQKTTLLDYPQKIACIVFSPACNFRCGYCHNPELNSQKKAVIELPSFFDFLKTRIGKLDGVVITGGEPTLQKDLIEFITDIKKLGFCVKLDTNGSNPNIIKQLIDKSLIDYVAMDIKAPVYKYQEVTNSNIDTDKIKESVSILLNNHIDYEFRTTVVKEQLSVEDFEQIASFICGAKKYYLQKFEPSKTLDPAFINKTTYSDKEFEIIKNILEKKVKFVGIR